MSDSKKLPTIEVGDTVVFRTDLKEWESYGGVTFKEDMMSYLGASCKVSEYDKIGCLKVEGGVRWFSDEMVAEVIKPTKERMYSEEEMKQCWEKAFNEGLSWSDEDFTPIFFKDFIQSLNK